MIKNDPYREFSFFPLFESLFELESFAYKKMFGGLAIYLNQKMVTVLSEDKASHSWKGTHYPVALWNGILIPTDFPFHFSLQRDLPGTMNHPILKKWMYLPFSSPVFEETAGVLVELIANNDDRIGVFPSLRKRKSKLKSKSKRFSGRRKP